MNDRFPLASIVALLVISGGALVADALQAQESGARTVADGVYTDAQAARGAAAYDASCGGCHRPDLGGASGPSLKAQRFTRDFGGKDLKALFTKIATTMPRNAPASLGEDAYLDIVAHVLKENGFPTGSQELTAAALDGVRVLAGRAQPPPPLGDFSYVDLVGCVAAGPDGTWLLTRASDPVALAAAAPAASTTVAGARPLGGGTLHLIDAAAYAADRHVGHKVYVRGLLIRLPDEQRMTISAFEMVSAVCQ